MDRLVEEIKGLDEGRIELVDLSHIRYYVPNSEDLAYPDKLVDDYGAIHSYARNYRIWCSLNSAF